jgi:hypothetical protein
MRNILISGFAGICIGVALVYCLTPEPDPVVPEIVEVVNHAPKWNKPPVTACEKSPIVIEAVMADDVMDITAGDGCKTASASVRMECPAPPTDIKSHAVAFGAGALAALILVIFL